MKTESLHNIANSTTPASISDCYALYIGWEDCHFFIQCHDENGFTYWDDSDDGFDEIMNDYFPHWLMNQKLHSEINIKNYLTKTKSELYCLGNNAKIQNPKLKKL